MDLKKGFDNFVLADMSLNAAENIVNFVKRFVHFDTIPVWLTMIKVWFPDFIEWWLVVGVMLVWSAAKLGAGKFLVDQGLIHSQIEFTRKRDVYVLEILKRVKKIEKQLAKNPPVKNHCK